MSGHQYWRAELCSSQEVGGTLIGEDRLVVMAGVESGKWYPDIIMRCPPLSSLLSCSYIPLDSVFYKVVQRMDVFDKVWKPYFDHLEEYDISM